MTKMPGPYCFADDSKITSGIKSEDEMTKVQDTLNKIYKWIADNGMALNTDKSDILRIGALQ